MSSHGRARPRLVARLYLYSLASTVVAAAVIAVVALALGARAEHQQGTVGLVTVFTERVPIERAALLSIGLVLVALLVVSLLFARSLSRPLRRLAAAAEALGSGDLSARAGVARADEFGTVGRAFDMMADRIERLVRSQRELIANVSHELRTPLSRVRVVLDLMDDGSDLAEMRGRLAEITQDFEEIERLVDDVLTAARLDMNEGGSFPMRSFHSTSLADLITACATRFRAMYGGSHKLEVVLPEEKVAIFADLDLLRRAIGNLLDNARKYSAVGSTVTLRGAGDGRHATIEVRDNGVGIEPADLTQLFQPFFRGDRSRTRTTGGVGLGLAITKRIAEAHQGRVRVESTPGIGTTVRIELDQVPPPPTP